MNVPIGVLQGTKNTMVNAKNDRLKLHKLHSLRRYYTAINSEADVKPIFLSLRRYATDNNEPLPVILDIIG